MSIKPTYINLPIYSITTYNEFYYISGGGGGKTGIKNQIFIYKREITKQPINRIETGDKLAENMIVDLDKKLMICSMAENIHIYHIQDSGASLKHQSAFKADFATKNSTIYSLCFHSKRNILCSAGQDMTIRFFDLSNPQNIVFSHSNHSNPLKNVDHNDKNLFLSCDTNDILITDIEGKKIVRRVSQSQLQPQKSLFQSAYFQQTGSSSLVMCHFIFRRAAYLTKQSGNNFQTVQLTPDQSCLTAYHKQMKIMGIACGNGSTYMVSVANMKLAGKEHRHSFVITGGTMSRGGRFVTGTPQCSYHVQQADQPIFGCSFLPLYSIILALILVYLLGSVDIYEAISQIEL